MSRARAAGVAALLVATAACTASASEPQPTHPAPPATVCEVLPGPPIAHILGSNDLVAGIRLVDLYGDSPNVICDVTAGGDLTTPHLMIDLATLAVAKDLRPTEPQVHDPRPVRTRLGKALVGPREGWAMLRCHKQKILLRVRADPDGPDRRADVRALVTAMVDALDAAQRCTASASPEATHG